MTREVKRYQVLAVCTHPSASITYRTENVESCDGEYVLYSDYAALKAKLSAVQAGADRLVEALNELRSCSRAKIGMEDDFACADKQMRDALANVKDAPLSERRSS